VIGSVILSGRCFAPSSRMQLVADRFAVHEDGRAFDLSSGARVTLIVGSAGGVAEQLRWIERCDTLRALRHRAVATLLDFGLVGDSSRFEAWRCGSELRAAEETVSLHARATWWLRACGLTTGPLLPDAVRLDSDGHGAWLPDAGTGYPHGEAAEDCGLSIEDRGLRIVEQPIVGALAEMFQAAASGRPHVAAIWGPSGSGKGAVVGELARLARAKGLVPVAARLLESHHADLWRGRNLFVIADTAGERPWPAFLRAALRDPVSHVFLLVGEDECRAVSGAAIRRLTVDALTAAIRPQAMSGRVERAVQQAAERSCGLPGRFVQLLWPGWGTRRIPAPQPGRSKVLRVAEQTAVYGGGDEPLEERFEPPVLSRAWPAPGELVTLRRRMANAMADVRRGLHAPGVRQLRQVVGSLARRGAWNDAAGGALALAGSLLRRGRTRDAQAVIKDGHDYARRAGLEGTLVDFAVLSGDSWIDAGRLDEADSVLGVALSAARALEDPERVAAASLVLARSAYWRGEYAGAEAVLASAPEGEATVVRRRLLASRLAVGLGDLNRAMSVITRVSEDTAAGDAGTRAAVAAVTAFVHLAAGDVNAAERDLLETIALARTARDVQRITRARLLRAEVERARGRPAIALAQLQRLGRVVKTAPPIARARWDLAKALSAPDAVARDVVARHVRGTGLGALGLYVAAFSSAGASSRDGAGVVSGGVPDPFVDELVAILRVCQTAADEIELLKTVCARVRQHLHASAIACVVVRGERAQVISGDGMRLETAIAVRAVTAGIMIAPHRLDDRIEAAAPIEYGGERIGALCARWTIGSTYDTSRAGSVLTMSAAAVAPMVTAVIARQAQVDAGPGELLGITPAMAALRQSVDRAAAAPFAVLIDGESGSGKELVARAIHRGSGRRPKPFCTLNCAALPDDLVEAELFGHTRGAFTGAVADRHGVFEEAHGGTLFLDEIGELTPRAQAKLLRVIQEGELRRVGENVSRRVDVRIVSATNRALRQEVEAGRFRLDLLYRLDVVHITVPPLRERREDVAVLAEHLWRDATQRVASRATLGAATIAALTRYDWPGNVRELQNVLAALAVRTPKRGVVPASALPPCFGESGPAERWSLDEARRTFEHRFVRAALVRTGGHRGRAAAELGVTRQGLAKLITRLGIRNS